MRFAPDALLQIFVASVVAALSYHAQLHTLWHWIPVAAAPFLARQKAGGIVGLGLAVVFVAGIILAGTPTVASISACAAAGLFAVNAAPEPCGTLGARSTQRKP